MKRNEPNNNEPNLIKVHSTNLTLLHFWTAERFKVLVKKLCLDPKDQITIPPG